MDFFKMIEAFKGYACVVSHRVHEEDKDKAITIVAANKHYLKSVGKGFEEFVPGRPYSYYITGDPNFEAFVKDCVAEHRIFHQYVNAELYDSWIDLYLIPLEDDDEGNGYCLFTYEMSHKTDTEKMSAISADTAIHVLKTCIKFRMNDKFQTTLDSVVQDIRSQCESDGCTIILMDQGKRKIDILSVDSGSDFATKRGDIFFREEFYNVVETWRDFMSGSNCIVISNEDELKAVEEKNPEWYKTLVISGVKSLVLYPLRNRDNLYGYIFATNFNVENTTFIREIMELNSYILSAEVENFRMRQQLEILSTTDSLTGVLNRNAMNRRISTLEAGDAFIGKGFGVVYVDMNGLKTVNDTYGHGEGDKMIKKIADKLSSVYEGKEIYRAGGDEFVVITADTEKEEFDRLYETLKSLSNVKGEPSFSLGTCYCQSGIDIKKIMKTADADMYKNKNAYYSANPEAERRCH